jgi:S1-C subfamily serine protease
MKAFILTLLTGLAVQLPAQSTNRLVSTSTASPIAAPGAPKQREAAIRTDAIIKVNVNYQEHNLHLPWQKQSPGQRRGLGVILKDNRILVTGQMVPDATYLELELSDGSQKIPGKVLAVDYEANIALLTANVGGERAAKFFAGLKPMELDTQAHIGDQLSIWQTGRVGDLLVTPLRIAKINTQRYIVEGATFLAYEGQGILRSEGNSYCLPVVKGGKLAGLMLRYDSKNQVTTVLPAPLIEHFLKDYEQDQKVDGFPSMGVEMHQTQDDQFRDYLGLKPEQGGMFVGNVVKGGSASALGIQKGDVLIEVAGMKVDSRGDYEDPEYGKLSVGHLVRGKAYVGDELAVKVLRKGEQLELKGKLVRKEVSSFLVKPYVFDRGPNYVLMGGLVLQELSKPYLSSWGENMSGAVAKLNHLSSHTEELEKEGKKSVVFLSAVLPTQAAQGYDRVGGQRVTKINGVEINELSDADKAFKAPVDGIHKVEIDGFPRVLFLDAVTAERDNLKLLGGQFRVGSLKRLE